MSRIKKGDVVTVRWGRDKGKSGKVLRIWPAAEKALVEKVNVLKHFDRKSQQNPSGGIVERESPLAISMLAITCPKCTKPVRIGVSVSNDGTRQRICRSCNSAL